MLVCLFTGLPCLSCRTSRLSDHETAFVYVAANGVITFQGRPVILSELPQTLKMAGATRTTPIKIVPQGEVSLRVLRSIAGNIGRQGMPRVLIQEPRKAVTIIDGQTTEEELPDALHPSTSTPRQR
jgi:biopolymer transport protein ExbD